MTILQDILRVSPTSSPYELYAVGLPAMCHGLQSQHLEDRSHLDDATVEQLKAYYGDRLTLHTVFDIPHDSDESCSAHVLCDQQKPVLLARCVGDRSSYDDDVHVLDKAFAKELLAQLIRLKAERQLQELDENLQVVPDALARVHNVRYLSWVTDSAFTVENPKWALDFESLFKQYAAFVLTAEGQLLRVSRFNGWTRQGPRWESDSVEAVVLPETGEPLIADASQVVFTLLADVDSVAAIHRALTAPDNWYAAHWFERSVCLLTVLQHRQGNAVPKQCCIGFEAPHYAEAFMAEFSQRRDGDFFQDMDAQMRNRPGVLRWDVSVARATATAA